MKTSALFVSASAIMAAASFAQAQHSYLPVQDAQGKIHTFVDPDSDGPDPFAPDRVVSSVFTGLFDPGEPNALPGLDPNAARSGAPSAFAEEASHPAFSNELSAFSHLPGGADLMITNPVLSHPMLNGSGNLLYWDGSGNAPSFGAVPSDVRIEIRRQDGGNVDLRATLDGGLSPVTWLEDTLKLDDPATPNVNEEGDRNGHFHIQYDVVGENGGGTFQAPDGIYLLGHIAGVSGLTDSEMVAIPLMLNRGGSVDLGLALQSAIGFLETNIVPEPTTGLVLAVMGGLALSTRRRKASA